jgi:hypothetical protein
MYLPEGPTLGDQYSFDCTAKLNSPTWGSWNLTYRVRVVERELFIADLRIEPVGGEGNWPRDKITRVLLRALPVDGLLNEVRVWMSTNGKPFTSDPGLNKELADTPAWAQWKAARTEFVRQLDHVRSGTKGRPYGRTDAELREVAEAAAAIGQQQPRGWLQELARQRGELAADGITVGQPLKDAIRDCRQRVRYLATTTRGSQAPPTPGVALLALWKSERDNRYEEWSQRLLTMNGGKQ